MLITVITMPQTESGKLHELYTGVCRYMNTTVHQFLQGNGAIL